MSLHALPNMSGHAVVAALQKVEFFVAHEADGHIVLCHKDAPVQLVVPDADELDRATLWAILRQGGISIDEFLWLL